MPKLRVPSPAKVMKPKKVSRSIHIEAGLALDVSELAEEHGTTFNRLVSLALEFYLAEWRRSLAGRKKP